MNRILRKKYINTLSILGVVIILFLSSLSYWQVMQFRKASQWVIHSYEVLTITELILSDLNYAETRQRNYFLSGEKSYIVLYKQVVNNIFSNNEKLRNLLIDNPTQHQKAVSLTYIINQRIDMLSLGITIYETQGLAFILKNIGQGKGEIVLNEARRLGNDIIDEEKKILVNRIDEMYSKLTTINRIQIAVVICGVGLVLFCLWLLNKQIILHSKAKKKIRESEDELFRLAYYDTLTGLPNRTLFINKVDQAICNLKNKNTAVLFLVDIDNFKSINNSMSHDIGDELLMGFFDKIHGILNVDDIVSHLGADEFAILSTVTEVDDINVLSKKIINCFREPIMVRSHKLFITVSMGISVYPHNGLDAKTLLKNADIAMYRAKELGKNNYQFCTPEMILQVEERALLDYYLHQALQRDEFILLYQPKISLKEGKIIGLEALMRWERPSVGMVLPESFINLAENNGMIVPISEWLLRTVCAQAKKWQSQGLFMRNIAINVSTRQFSISDFSSTIKKILDETNIDPALLEFEITERIFMESSFDNFSALRSLKEMGIKITIDDFGTEYSSLSYLRNFSIDKIKIDQSFVKEITEDNQESSIINAIIVMAHSLGITVVAEGVETSIQASVLKMYGCDEVQGYLYNHPLSADEITKLLQSHT